MRHVDWTPLLTRHIVDDFASHIRIYRKARDKLRIEQISAQRMVKLVFFQWFNLLC